MLVPYRWSNGRLRARERYMADKSTFVDLVKAITERYAGVNPAATGRWMRLHGAAQELLAACEMYHEAIDLLFVRLIILDKTFLPSKAGLPWDAMVKGKAAMDKARGLDEAGEQ